MKKLMLAFAAFLAFSASAMAAVDLNTASQAELETVKGIGPAKAKAIIDFRKKSGGFKSVDDLDKVEGFGKKTVDSVRKEITVGNAKAAVAGKPDKSVKEAATRTVGNEKAATSGKTADSKVAKEKGGKK